MSGTTHRPNMPRPEVSSGQVALLIAAQMLRRMLDSQPHNAAQQGRLAGQHLIAEAASAHKIAHFPLCAPTHHTQGDYPRTRTICTRTTSSPGCYIAKNHTSHISWNATTLSLRPICCPPSPSWRGGCEGRKRYGPVEAGGRGRASGKMIPCHSEGRLS